MRRFAALALFVVALGCNPEAMDIGLPPEVDEATLASDKTEFAYLQPNPDEATGTAHIGPYRIVRTVSVPKGKEGEIESWLRFEAIRKGDPPTEGFRPTCGVRLEKSGRTYAFAIDLKLSSYRVYRDDEELGMGSLNADVRAPEQAMAWLSPAGAKPAP